MNKEIYLPDEFETYMDGGSQKESDERYKIYQQECDKAWEEVDSWRKS
jgi:hypothetical protein